MSASLRKVVIVDTATRELWNVAENGDVHGVAVFLSRGVNVNGRNEHGTTALMRAARNGHVEVVRTLLDHGADPNIARNDKFTALALAAFFGHTETVRLLIDHGAKTEVVTRSGTSPRLWATARTFTETARCFEKPAAPFRPVRAPVLPEPAPIPVLPVPVAAAPQVIKTLKDPPEIWDLVHEVPRDFNAGSAFLTRIKSVKWPVLVGAFAVLVAVACGVGLFVSRSSKTSNVSVELPRVQTPVQTAAKVPVTPAPQAPAPVESPVTEAAPVAVTRKAPPVTRQPKPRAVAEENVAAVTPSREEPQVVAPQVEKPKQRESPVKSAPNPALSPHLIAPAKNAKVIQWP